MNNTIRPGTITIAEFEAEVLAVEELVIVVRASKNQRTSRYPFPKKSGTKFTVKEFIELRLAPSLGTLECEILLYNGTLSSKDTTIAEIKRGYSRYL